MKTYTLRRDLTLRRIVRKAGTQLGENEVSERVLRWLMDQEAIANPDRPATLIRHPVGISTTRPGAE